MKLADYSDQVTVAQLDAALRAGGFQGVFHYLAGNFARRIEDPAVVAGIRARGWPQAGIDVPTLGSVNGAAAAARTRNVYAFGDGFQLYLDIEPGEYDLDPGGWAVAADRWCDAVRAAGLLPGVYGVDRTVAACANRADRIWRAKPGMCDPAGPGLADAFFRGRRAVQCGAGNFGVEMDINFSQFDLTGGIAGGDDEMAGFADTTLGEKLDELANVLLGGGDNRVPTPAIYAVLASVRGDEAGVLAAVQAQGAQLAAVSAEFEALKVILANVAAGNVDEQKLAADLEPHLGADVAAELAKRLAG